MTRANSLWLLALLFTTPLFAQEKPASPADKTNESTSSTIVFFREGHYAGRSLGWCRDLRGGSLFRKLVDPTLVEGQSQVNAASHQNVP